MSKYNDPRAHALRHRWLATFGGDEIPVPVEAIAEDLLGLRVEDSWDMAADCSGMLLPAERLIVVNATELRFRDPEPPRQRSRAGSAGSGNWTSRDVAPFRRRRWTIAHEVGHWVCHAVGANAPQATYCRAPGVPTDGKKDPAEREVDIFAAELLLPEHAVRASWCAFGYADGGVDVDDATAAMARHFDVSPTAMHWRLFSYELVPEGPPPGVSVGET